MQAYDKDNNLINELFSKEGEPIESFFDKCASVFKEEEVARMEIFKKRETLDQKLERLEKEEFEKNRIDRPYYRKNRY